MTNGIEELISKVGKILSLKNNIIDKKAAIRIIEKIYEDLQSLKSQPVAKIEVPIDEIMESLRPYMESKLKIHDAIYFEQTLKSRLSKYLTPKGV